MKKQQKTPKREIELAHQRRTDYPALRDKNGPALRKRTTLWRSHAFGKDIRLSTLGKYAKALGMKLRVELTD